MPSRIHAQEPALQHLCSIRLLWRAAILRRRASQNGFDPFDQPAFAKRQRLLSTEQYELVEARPSRGVSRVMLFSKAIIQAEWEGNAPLREALATKRERLRALRAKRVAKQCST